MASGEPSPEPEEESKEVAKQEVAEVCLPAITEAEAPGTTCGDTGKSPAELCPNETFKEACVRHHPPGLPDWHCCKWERPPIIIADKPPEEPVVVPAADVKEEKCIAATDPDFDCNGENAVDTCPAEVDSTGCLSHKVVTASDDQGNPTEYDSRDSGGRRCTYCGVY